MQYWLSCLLKVFISPKSITIPKKVVKMGSAGVGCLEMLDGNAIKISEPQWNKYFWRFYCEKLIFLFPHPKKSADQINPPDE